MSLFTTSRGSLETKLLSPSNGTVHVPTKIAVFTHPWALLGGNMHDPAFHALKPLFLSRGFHILLYNARSSFTGISEAQDLQELVHGVINNAGGQIDCIVLLGYSHGSLITSMHPLLPPPVKTYHILLSYPLSVRGLITLFHGATYDSTLRELVRNSRSRVLVLYGNHDQFTSPQSYEPWISRLKSEAHGRLSTVMVDGADHFWRGRPGKEMCSTVGYWLDEI